ncbi:MAG: endopeptidase La [Alloprevotella sp.]|nr:endopeptidase La [Alloprevotella sp.]
MILKDNTPPSFSFVADFDGDMSGMFNKKMPETLPILPLRNMVLFPGIVAPVSVGRESSLKLIANAEKTSGYIGVVGQIDANVQSPNREDMYNGGVLAKVVKTFELPDGGTTVLLQSYGRFSLGEFTRVRPFIRAKVDAVPEILPEEDDKEFKAYVDACRDLTLRYMKMNENIPTEATFAVKNVTHPIFLINFICTNLPFDTDEKDALLSEGDLKLRAKGLLQLLNREVQYIQLRHDIQEQTREELDKQQKEYFLQQQIRNIQDELGEASNEDVVRLREKAAPLNLPEKVAETFENELKKLERMSPQSPDYHVALNYLQTLTSLPWGKETEDDLNLKHAEQVLNKEHYGMEKVKERILEHLAVLRLRKEAKAPILCLYGAPGVGKTSLGRSIAESMGRKYQRISLGGVHDESEIRGHRRTYIGAMPGRIVKSLIKAESDNPVFVLDEIDKVASNTHQGDPQSALLEVLDPEQNKAFHDNYLDVDYDLSKVFFIATANSLNTIPRPLLDRMELIDVEGYITEEKIEIAKRHLLPRINKELNVEKKREIKVATSGLEFIIEKYTRESGVRQLEKQLQKLSRKVAFLYAKEEEVPGKGKALTAKEIQLLLGKPLFSRDRYQGNKYAGVVTGLAWTSVGGEILMIESSLSRSKAPRLTLTGNLGDVMKESAMLALEYVKAHADRLNIDYRIFEQWSLHVHVPEGATPKDGPSAGITITTSIVSALTQRKVRANVAMTGEITLRGKVLPVGGIKEKILAAKRAGITDIVMSSENEKDILEINEKYIKGLNFHFVDDISQVLSFAIMDEQVDNPIQLIVETEVTKTTDNEHKPFGIQPLKD